MIVLKILLYILLVVAAIILFVLVIPLGGEYSYIDGKFKYKIKVWFLNFMDSEGGGLFRWWKKRKANKKDKPEKTKKTKPVKSKKSKKKKQREQYEWEKELEDIPVNDPEADTIAAENTAETVSESAGDATKKIDTIENSEEIVKADTSSEKKSSDDEYGDIYDEEDDEDEDDGSSISDKLEKLVVLWESADRPALKILNGIRIYDLYIDFVIADEDAYKCALNYGKYSAAIFNGLAVFSEIFTIRFKTVDVRPQFGASKGRWDTSGKIAFRLGTLVIAGAWFLITYLFRTFLPEKIRKRKMKKSAARQK